MIRLLLLFFCLTTLAKEEEVSTKRLPVKLDRVLKIQYQQRGWNKDSTKIDSANALMKDKTSGRLILIRLQETEPDSGEFFGYFSIGWQDQSEIVPLLYVPPQNVTSERQLKDLINSGKLKRKPYVIMTDENTGQRLEVFDDKEQALIAFQNYKKQKRLKLEAEKPKPTPIPDESLREAQRQAAIEAEKKRLAELARQQELERIRLEKLAAQKALEARKRAANLEKAEKERRQKEAKKLAAQAMKAYQSGDFAYAEGLFQDAVELDPENDTYYFQYGVTLYRNNKHNKSLVYLDIAKSDQVNPAEVGYFKALNHLRLKDFPNAIKNFDIAIAGKDKVIAPSSAFYKGIVHFSTEEYDKARDDFQLVLDTSADPKLDRQAEGYIDKILKIKQFQELQKQPFSINVLTALMHDSNVLSVDVSGGTAGETLENQGSMRTLATLEFGYRPIFTANHELNIAVNGLTMNTTKESLRTADPVIYGLKIPYKYRGKLFDAGWQLSSTLTYSALSIASKSFMNSTGLNLDSTHIPGQKWAHTVKLGFTSASPTQEQTTSYSDITATTLSLKYSAANFLNEDKTQSMSYDVGVTSSNAKGENSTFTRIDVAVGYNRPAFWAMGFTSKLSAYSSNYPKFFKDTAFTTRSDVNYSLNLGLNKSFKKWLTGISAFTYAINDSSITGSDYNKYSIMIGVLMSPRF